MSAQPTPTMERTPTPAPTLKPSRRSTHLRNTWHLGIKEFHSLARDMALLAQAIARDFPEHEMYFRIPALQVGKIVKIGPRSRHPEQQTDSKQRAGTHRRDGAAVALEPAAFCST